MPLFLARNLFLRLLLDIERSVRRIFLAVIFYFYFYFFIFIFLFFILFYFLFYFILFYFILFFIFLFFIFLFFIFLFLPWIVQINLRRFLLFLKFSKQTLNNELSRNIFIFFDFFDLLKRHPQKSDMRKKLLYFIFFQLIFIHFYVFRNYAVQRVLIFY